MFGLPLEAAPREEWVLRGEKTGLVFSVPGLVPSYGPMMATCSCTVMRQDSVLTFAFSGRLYRCDQERRTRRFGHAEFLEKLAHGDEVHRSTTMLDRKKFRRKEPTKTGHALA